ncbi:MAG: MBL fold metallo-hydrolase [Promethearchaeota archaeon]
MRTHPSLEITHLRENVYHITQTTSQGRFSSCDGLLCLPSNSNDSHVVILDLNLEPPFITEVFQTFNLAQYERIDYFISHAHMDHIANVWKWEELGANIFLPSPFPSNILLNPLNFLKHFHFEDYVSLATGYKLCETNGFHPCRQLAKSYSPRDLLPIDSIKLTIMSIPLYGHSIGHTGYLFPDLAIVHISCLGYDLRHPYNLDNTDYPKNLGFGPWYGFPDCSLSQYWADISKIEEKFEEFNQEDQLIPILTSSHAHVIRGNATKVFDYMRQKIMKLHEKIRTLLRDLNLLDLQDEEKILEILLKKDIIFPKRKMQGWLQELYTFWEYWLLKLHLPFTGYTHPTFDQPH